MYWVVFKVIKELSGYIEFLLIKCIWSLRLFSLYNCTRMTWSWLTYMLECHNHAGGVRPRGKKLKEHLIQQSCSLLLLVTNSDTFFIEQLFFLRGNFMNNSAILSFSYKSIYVAWIWLFGNDTNRHASKVSFTKQYALYCVTNI